MSGWATSTFNRICLSIFPKAPTYLELLVMGGIKPQGMALDQRDIERLVPVQEGQAGGGEGGDREVETRLVVPRAQHGRLLQPALAVVGQGRGGGGGGGG